MNMNTKNREKENPSDDASARQYSKPLAPLMLVSARQLMRPSTLDALRHALEGGARLIQLREKDLSHAEALALVRAAEQLCAAFDAQLLLNLDHEVTPSAHVGLHLPESRVLHLAQKRAAFGPHVLMGASVHSKESATQAAAQGANYVVFGSVFATASHPDNAPAGLPLLREVCAATKLPVYAIGGIAEHNVPACLDAGAHGVAVMRAVWEKPDVATAVRQLNAVLPAVRP
jgi:thiamine-phosphate pyrophosphorylase